MANTIIITDYFARRYKKFVKKFPSLKNELNELNDELTENPQMGIHLGDNIYKIRLASKSKGKGKSGGFRVITYLIEQIGDDYEINLITMYDKSEDSNILKTRLQAIIKELFG